MILKFDINLIKKVSVGRRDVKRRNFKILNTVCRTSMGTLF